MDRIVALETVIPEHIVPNLILVRVHTESGLTGCGETYYTPHAIQALIHDWMAERLLGADALQIEAHWRFLYERCSSFGQLGAEMRALSALDVALWDILGQTCEQPIYRLLGGPVRPRIPVYNTCGGPGYGAKAANQDVASTHPGWPGFGDEGQPGPLQDNWASFHNAGELAKELVAAGVAGMKVWPFDRFAQQHGGLRISWRDVESALKPLRDIRDAVGMDIEIMIEGHAFFQLPAALRIAEALREIKPLWLEDVLRVDNIATLAEFRQRSGMPIAASEMFLARRDFLELLQRGAADFVMIDPTWCGGISESMRLVHLAQAFNVPVTMHDCTGPATLFAGMHVAAAASNVVFQETVRAHIHTFYEHLIDDEPQLVEGHLTLPVRAGLGMRFRDDLFMPQANGYRRSQTTTG